MVVVAAVEGVEAVGEVVQEDYILGASRFLGAPLVFQHALRTTTHRQDKKDGRTLLTIQNHSRDIHFSLLLQ
jgi:hypothetical protein